MHRMTGNFGKRKIVNPHFSSIDELNVDETFRLGKHL